MKREYQLALLLASFTAGSQYAGALPVDMETDTLRNFNIEEAVVVASPKETTFLKKQPLSATLFGGDELTALQVKSVKDLSAFAPNFHMPAYGSRLSSAVYIRGVGARVNTPAIGLYVDNVAYTDKTSYYFSFLDVERVDVLRGPQGTLYGRNTMGGLMRVFTADPLKKHGTTLQLGGETHGGNYHAKAVTYLHPSDRLGISVGGFYEGRPGYFDNTLTGKEADQLSAGGGKIRAAWRPSAALRMDWTAAYEYSDENACPYRLEQYDAEKFPGLQEYVGQIAQNRQSNYRRNLLNASWATEWTAPRFVLSSVTGYQHINDRLFMDQDFSPLDVFSLAQSQKGHTLTEEITLRTHRNQRWQWTMGAFFMYQKMNTGCPVTFYDDGVAYLNQSFKGMMGHAPMPMGLKITSSTLPFDAQLSTPNVNGALYHQSTFNDLLIPGLSLTMGLRLDYDRQELDLHSALNDPLRAQFWIGNPAAARPLEPITASFSGKDEADSWQLLPKIALQYQYPNNTGNVYFAVSKGYRSGGYNIQAYSDLSQQLVRREVMLQAIPPAMQGMMDKLIPAVPEAANLAYKPEVSWNYELGGHLFLLDGLFNLDYTFFLMQTTNQQLARFAESGMGRVTVNAGKSQSCGAELALRSQLLDRRLSLSASYGYTYAELKEHHLGKANGQPIDYSGNRVPFAPEHTFGATVAYRQPLDHQLFKAVTLGADVQGAGRVYWDEANTYSQPFYATLGLRANVELSDKVTFEVYGKNLTDAAYDTFSFESLGNRFAQRAVPRHFGATLRLDL